MCRHWSRPNDPRPSRCLRGGRADVGLLRIDGGDGMKAPELPKVTGKTLFIRNELYTAALARAEKAEAELATARELIAMLEGEQAHADRAEALLAEAVEALKGWAAIYENCSISTGYCCCGDAMEGHANPMNCGHSPVDQGGYYASQQIESARATLAKIKEAGNG
jgi:hypothetical protein